MHALRILEHLCTRIPPAYRHVHPNFSFRKLVSSCREEETTAQWSTVIKFTFLVSLQKSEGKAKTWLCLWEYVSCYVTFCGKSFGSLGKDPLKLLRIICLVDNPYKYFSVLPLFPVRVPTCISVSFVFCYMIFVFSL